MQKKCIVVSQIKNFTAGVDIPRQTDYNQGKPDSETYDGEK